MSIDRTYCRSTKQEDSPILRTVGEALWRKQDLNLVLEDRA